MRMRPRHIVLSAGLTIWLLGSLLTVAILLVEDMGLADSVLTTVTFGFDDVSLPGHGTILVVIRLLLLVSVVGATTVFLAILYSLLRRIAKFAGNWYLQIRGMS